MNRFSSLHRSAWRFALVALFALALQPFARAATISFAPTVSSVSVGDVFTIDLTASDVSNGIGAWDFVLGLSTSGIASFTGVSFSGALGAGSLDFGDHTSDFGSVSLLSAADLLALQGTSFTLATLSFTALAAGTVDLSLSAPVNGELLSDADGLAIAGPSVGTGTINVTATTAIPEPSTYALMLLGLAVVGGAARRRSRA